MSGDILFLGVTCVLAAVMVVRELRAQREDDEERRRNGW